MPTPVSALIHAATLVTAGIYLLLRSSWLLEYSPLSLVVIVLVGSITAFFAATSGLVQNDIKRIVAFSTISQLGYMVAAIGLSQYNVALFHLVNHAFFVRQHRYLNLDFNTLHVLESLPHAALKWYDGPSFRNLLKKGISTSISFKFKLNLRWERLMKMNFRQNCIIMIKIFYSSLPFFIGGLAAYLKKKIYIFFLVLLTLEKFIMEKINEGSQVMSRCRIEKISSPYFGNIIFLMKIVQILKVGKLVHGIILIYFNIIFIVFRVAKTFINFCRMCHYSKIFLISRHGANYFFNLILPCPCFYLKSTYGHVNLWIINYLKDYNIKGLHWPAAYTLLLWDGGRTLLCSSAAQPTSVYYLSYNPINSYSSINKSNLKIFKKECKELFKPYKSINKILYELNIKIPNWLSLLENTYKNISFIKNFLHKRSFLWMIKKHKNVSRNILYNLYFKNGSFNFSLLKTNKDIKNFNKNFKRNYSKNNKADSAPAQNIKFDLAKLDLQFINVEKEYLNILNALNKNNSGIYLF